MTPEQQASWDWTADRCREDYWPLGVAPDVVLAVDAELRDLRAEVARLNRDPVGQESDAATRMMEFLRLFDEVETLRAALAASQTREAALRAALVWIFRHDQWRRDHPSAARNLEYWADTIGKPALADPSPASDALGRVVRAAVVVSMTNAAVLARRAQEQERGAAGSLRLWEWPEHTAHLEAQEQLIEAVKSLLAVAPHWGEPRGGG